MTPGVMQCSANGGCWVQMQPTENATPVTETPPAPAETETEQPELKTAGVGGGSFMKRNLPGAGFHF